MQPDRAALGLQGERLAEAYLRGRGFRALARRYRTKVGELDLVMRDGETIVFVEVKTLARRTHQDPQERVTPAKQAKLARTAAWFLRSKRWEGRACRFDVVSVVCPPGGEPEIEHFPEAFVPECNA